MNDTLATVVARRRDHLKSLGASDDIAARIESHARHLLGSGHSVVDAIATAERELLLQAK